MFLKQECIPVGCVPHIAVSICWGVSASVHAGIPPQGVGLELPLGVGLETPPGQTPNFPPGCGPGDPPGQTPQLPPRVWAWRPARHAGIPPPCGQTDTCKNITFANLRAVKIHERSNCRCTIKTIS